MTLFSPDSPQFAVLPENRCDEPCFGCGQDYCTCDDWKEERDNDVLEYWV